MATTPSNICCATLYDKAFATIGAFARNSLVRYGSRHGYDVIHSAGGDSTRPISWHKLQLIESLFDTGYEFVLWVDADAVFVDFEQDIAQHIQPNKHLYLVRHKINSRLCPNMGVFLLRNCEWSRRFLRQLWNLEQYVQHPWWETAAITHLLHHEEFTDQQIVNLDGPHLSEKHLQWLPDRWNYLPRVTEDGPPVILHFAGNPFKKRLRRMLRSVNLAKHAWVSAQYRFQPLTESAFPANVCVHRLTGHSFQQTFKRQAA